MPVSVSFVPKEDRLDLSFDGNLDITVSQAVCGISTHIPARLRTCVMDLTRVQRVFDSGIALLRMLCASLHQAGAKVVVLGDHPDLRRQIPTILGYRSLPVPRRSAAAAALV